MEITTSWKEEGLKEGQLNLVLRQLKRRCGDLPPPVEKRVHALKTIELENLAEALLDFSSLADLRQWLREH